MCSLRPGGERRILRSVRFGWRWAVLSYRPCHGLAEQGENGLRRLVGDGQRLDAQLLLDLQRLEMGTFLRHVGVDQVADALSQGVGQLLGEGRLDRELRSAR